MTDQQQGESNNAHSQTADAEGQEAPEAHKSPKRLRQEEFFMFFARLMLITGVCWAGYYAFLSLTKTPDELMILAEETIHDSLQFGATIFLGAELLYYIFVSSSFRQCREWGMIVWLIGGVVLAMNLKFGIG